MLPKAEQSIAAIKVECLAFLLCMLRKAKHAKQEDKSKMGYKICAPANYSFARVHGVKQEQEQQSVPLLELFLLLLYYVKHQITKPFLDK